MGPWERRARSSSIYQRTISRTIIFSSDNNHLYYISFIFSFLFLSFFTHTLYRELGTLISHGLLLTFLTVTEARVIRTKISAKNMISELSSKQRDPFDIV